MATLEDMFEQAGSVQEVLGLAVGAGSSCWSNVREAGTFESARAADVVEKAHKAIARLHEEKCSAK